MHRSYISPTGTVTLLLAALVIGASATASARPKKDSAAPSSSSATQCHGTPVIMQGMDCPKYRARGDEQQQATDREKHPRVTVRGSGGIYAAPIQPTPSLTPLPSVTPYVPPAISNPSERIHQLNQSFPFNAGVGNNPTDRDSYIRYNLTR